jgi:menaquinone-9 beta-reductase
VSERADAVVVGARCAGSAAATALARAGRSVVVLDRARFPSDTISTHLLFPSGVAELASLGALDRVAALGAPPLTRASVAAGPWRAETAFSGGGHALCVRRPGLDAALVDTARAAGADVREGVRVTDLLWRDGRVTGVRCDDGEELAARLVVGADGRRSAVARLVGADAPYRRNANGRACYFAYWSDRAGPRDLASQWREGGELGTAFPCDDGQVMVLVMPPVGRIDAFREDLQGAYERTIAALPGLHARLAACEQATKVRAATDTTSYFRRSSGPGWALPGDAGHFKDPVTAQGIRDALRYGRLLGEAAAPALDDPSRLDAALVTWERRREAECLETYQWTNVLGRGEAMTPLEDELYRTLAHDEALTRELLDVFSRVRAPSSAFGPARGARLAAAALLRGDRPRSETLRAARRDLATAVADARERRRAARDPLPPVPAPPRAEEPARDEEAALR